MGLRTTALVAGVIGVLLLTAGLVADAQRPPRDVMAVASVDTAVVVYEPDMIAFADESRMGFEGDGDILALTARPVDASAWLENHDATVVTGLPDWATLSTDSAPAVEPSASPNASADPSASASPSPEPEPESSPSASASPGADADETVSPLAEGSTDHWREEYRGSGRLSIKASTVPAGETLVVISVDGSPITTTDLALTRDVEDGWITPLIWWGAFLVAVGVVALVLRFIDLRPAQAKGEEWMAKRQREGDGVSQARPGSRRARREAGEHLPEASLDEDGAAPPASPASEPSPGEPMSHETNEGEEQR